MTPGENCKGLAMMDLESTYQELDRAPMSDHAAVLHLDVVACSVGLGGVCVGIGSSAGVKSCPWDDACRSTGTGISDTAEGANEGANAELEMM